MLELFGRGYVIEHCVSTFNAIQREENYREYITEILRYIAKANGVEILMSYRDVVKASKNEVEERTSEEVINSIRQKADAIRG